MGLSCRESYYALHFATMHDFTRDTWTVEDTERETRRLVTVSDSEFLRGIEAANHMCSPAAYWSERRQSYLIQREIVRLEICRRGATALGLRE